MHVAVSISQGSASAPHWLGVPAPPQVRGAVQVPQLTVPPHPSEAAPQFWPVEHACAVVRGTHMGTHRFMLLQAELAAQVPQVTTPPHPFEMVPQT